MLRDLVVPGDSLPNFFVSRPKHGNTAEESGQKWVVSRRKPLEQGPSQFIIFPASASLNQIRHIKAVIPGNGGIPFGSIVANKKSSSPDSLIPVALGDRLPNQLTAN